jgi:hypothetical protein
MAPLLPPSSNSLAPGACPYRRDCPSRGEQVCCARNTWGALPSVGGELRARSRSTTRGEGRARESPSPSVATRVMLVGMVSMMRAVFAGHPHGTAEHFLDEA